jgi:hypothetical protein
MAHAAKIPPIHIHIGIPGEIDRIERVQRGQLRCQRGAERVDKRVLEDGLVHRLCGDARGRDDIDGDASTKGDRSAKRSSKRIKRRQNYQDMVKVACTTNKTNESAQTVLQFIVCANTQTLVQSNTRNSVSSIKP